MRSSLNLFFGLLFILVITACQAPQPKGTPPPSGTPSATPIPTSEPSKATVQGTIVVDMNGKTVPLKAASLFLSPILKDQKGIERVAQFDRATSPYTDTDSQGKFTFINVPPGRYVIILDDVVRAYLLIEPTTKYSLTLTATAGQVTDLKTLHYQTLPVTPNP